MRVGPYNLAVFFSDDLCDAEELRTHTSLWGFCASHEGRIVIREGVAPDFQREVLMHEVLHAVHDVMGTASQQPDTEEELVGRMAPALLRVFQDNPELVKYLAS